MILAYHVLILFFPTPTLYFLFGFFAGDDEPSGLAAFRFFFFTNWLSFFLLFDFLLLPFFSGMISMMVSSTAENGSRMKDEDGDILRAYEFTAQGKSEMNRLGFVLRNGNIIGLAQK